MGAAGPAKGEGRGVWSRDGAECASGAGGGYRAGGSASLPAPSPSAAVRPCLPEPLPCTEPAGPKPRTVTLSPLPPRRPPPPPCPPRVAAGWVGLTPELSCLLAVGSLRADHPLPFWGQPALGLWVLTQRSLTLAGGALSAGVDPPQGLWIPLLGGAASDLSALSCPSAWAYWVTGHHQWPCIRARGPAESPARGRSACSSC